MSGIAGRMEGLSRPSPGLPAQPRLVLELSGLCSPWAVPGCLSQLQLLAASAGIRPRYPFGDGSASGASGFWMRPLGCRVPGKDPGRCGGAWPSLSALQSSPCPVCPGRWGWDERGGEGTDPNPGPVRCERPAELGELIPTWTERAAALGLCHGSG